MNQPTEEESDEQITRPTFLSDIGARALVLVVGTSALAGCGASGSAHAGPTTVTSRPIVQPMGPSALALDAKGDLYVADFGVSVVFEISRDGKATVVAGTGVPGLTGSGGPATKAEIQNPDGLALGRDGTLYVSEHANNRIRRVDANGVIHAFAGAGPAVLNGGTFGGDGGPAAKAAFNVPTTIAFDSTGNLYVTDRDNDRVRRIEPSGTITTVAGNGTRGYSGDGGPATSAELSGPDGIAIDADGNLFVCDDGNRRIRRIGRDGVITTVAGTGRQATTGDGGAAKQASLTDPAGLAFDRHGNLFISDFSANRIRKIDTHGVIATIAGKRSPADGGFAGDGGSATAAQLRNPRGIVVDAAGNVYFSDGGNHRVRRIDTHGVITTVFGPTT